MLILEFTVLHAGTPVNSINNYLPTNGFYFDTMCVGDTIGFAHYEYDSLRQYYDLVVYDWSIYGTLGMFEIIGPSNQRIVLCRIIRPFSFTDSIFRIRNLGEARYFKNDVLQWFDSNGFNYLLSAIDCQPKANLVSEKRSICTGNCTAFSSISTRGPSAWQWLFPGATPASSTLENPPSVCYPLSGEYDVTLIVSNTKGADTMTVRQYIEVLDGPNGPTPWQGLRPTQGEALRLRPCIAARHYNWYIGDSLVCENCPTFNYEPWSVVTVTCEAYNGEPECKKVCTYILLTQEEPDNLFVPNSFTPNNDGANDEFTAQSKNVDILETNIFDRWGTQVFSTHNPQEGWNGTIHGEDLDAGVYIYKIRFRRKWDGSTDEKTGDVLLIR